MKSTVNSIKKVTSNKSLRHFTIIKEDGTKYRTIPMNKEEFEINDCNTLKDWEQFLKSDDYYKI